MGLFLLGLFVGWAVEFVLDFFFWRRAGTQDKGNIPDEVNSSSLDEIARLKKELEAREAELEGAITHRERSQALTEAAQWMTGAAAIHELSLPESVRKAGEELLSLRSRLEETNSALQQAQAKLDEQKSDVSQPEVLTLNPDNPDEKIAQLQAENLNLRSQMATADSLLARITDLEARTKSSPDSGSRISELERELEELQARVREADQDALELQRTAEEAELLRKKLSDCKAARDRLEAEVTRLKSDRIQQSMSATAGLLAGANQEALQLVESQRKDPLEKIDGIGKVFERKFWEAGVCTFAALAAATPEKITEIIQPESWQKIEPELWIQEAGEFARGEKK